MKRHRFQPDSLLEVLHTAQELFGFLDMSCLAYVGRCLKLPPSHVYGVATFYHFFSLKPAGEHTCVVCMGTACYVKGASAILREVEKALGVSSGETTADGKVSLVTARCLGACGVAPALVFDTDVAGKVTPPSALARLAGWSSHER
jgi:bidirectional [NiFe] hydrogenase diaphorase subunit